jgi:hypothetical protein
MRSTVEKSIVSLGIDSGDTRWGASLGIRLGGPYLDQNSNLASRIDISSIIPVCQGYALAETVMAFREPISDLFGVHYRSVFNSTDFADLDQIVHRYF